MDPAQEEFLRGIWDSTIQYLNEKLREKKLDKDSDEYNILRNFIDEVESDLNGYLKRASKK